MTQIPRRLFFERLCSVSPHAPDNDYLHTCLLEKSDSKSDLFGQVSVAGHIKLETFIGHMGVTESGVFAFASGVAPANQTKERAKAKSS